jgi:HK97 family phage prohead protease
MDERLAAMMRAAGAVTNPEGTERLHAYWVHGEGAAKIGWLKPGDFDRCVAELGKYIKDPEGYCNLAHHEATGMWPAEHAAMEKHAGRADMSDSDTSSATAPRAEFMRMYPLEDMHIIRSADGGDGRTVEAFAAVFDQQAEISDHEGHYLEEIDRSAFNRAIDHARASRGGLPGAIKVLYNHGMTIQGTPSERFSVPIGVPVEVRAEPRGLLTRTRYSETPLADEILESVRAGSITSQSFTGRIIRSTPQLARGDRYRPRRGELTVVRRTELGFREYGPVLWPAYTGAEILGVRMSTPGSFSPDPDEEQDPGTAPDDAPAAGDPLSRTDGGEHSARYHQHELFLLESKARREAAGLVW